MKCFKNISCLATLEPAHKKDGRNLDKDDIGILENGAIVFNENEILWVGVTSDLPSEYSNAKSFDLQGKTLTPELVDSHTHLIFGGNRAFEYSMRLNGESYEAIASAGGGILSTMKHTNNSSKEDLKQTAKERIERIHSYGVGTIEIKSGYGLNFEKEYELSKTIHELKTELGPEIQIINTFLAAHAVPKEYTSSSDYLDEVVLPLMDKLANEGIIDCVDIFQEPGYFTAEDTKKLFKKAQMLNINRKSHADEFKETDGAAIACSFNALSTDHLLDTSDKGIKALASSSTVANFLPGTAFFLGKPQVNARKFLDAGCKVGIASDYNPGSCHWDNVLQVASMSAPQYKMNQTELWASITLNASHALGLKNQGSIKVGLKPRFSLFNCESIDEITYNWGKKSV
jgi:imidazolonepropionase